MKNPHFLGWSPMFHWTDSKIQVHAFYCVLALLLTSLLQRELVRKGEPLRINRMLEELGGIRETLVVYPRRQGQRQTPRRRGLGEVRIEPGQHRAVPVGGIQRERLVRRYRLEVDVVGGYLVGDRRQLFRGVLGGAEHHGPRPRREKRRCCNAVMRVRQVAVDLPGDDPGLNPGYSLQNTATTDLGGGIIERTLNFTTIFGPVKLEETPLDGTLVVFDGSVPMAAELPPPEDV
jgi:hypothetical protein